MANNEEKKHTLTKVQEEAILNCVRETTLKVPGVSRLTGGLTESLSKNIFGIDPTFKGVKLSQNDDGLIFDIYVVVVYEAKIPQLAWDIQGKIKDAVMNISDYNVTAVNIHVQGVDSIREEK